MIQELPFRGRPIIPEGKDELVNGVWPQFIKPYPLTDETFLVTAKLSPYSRWGIYLVDIFDNLTLITEQEGEGLTAPIPLKKTETPPIIPSKIKPGEKDATVFIQDIYEGEGTQGVPRGTIKSLRIFAYEYAYILPTMMHRVFRADGILNVFSVPSLLKKTVPSCSRYRPTRLSLSSHWIKTGPLSNGCEAG